ncbi:cytochrome c-type biogenesis protein [Seminibacterium arietis]|uniref:Cytochrome c-type biogenesis protein n=1 Tax=Seminibacterium arietis TaxID=1173502 RepID=A0ABW3IBU7_9PAST
MLKIRYFITALIFILLNCSAFAAIEALNFSSIQQEKDYHSLTQELRCPQCQNNNIADSNATIAVDMRAKVFELLQQGKSKEDIVKYMVERYGYFVTYDPPITIATIILWLAPILLVLIGFLVIFGRKSQARKEFLSPSAVKINDELTDDEKTRLNFLLQSGNKRD